MKHLAVTRIALAAAMLLAALTGSLFCGALGAFIEHTGDDW